MTIELGVSIIVYIVIGLYLRREVKALKGELASQKSTLTSQKTLLNNFKTSMDAIDTHFKNYREIFDIPKLKDFVGVREETIILEKEREFEGIRKSMQADIEKLNSDLKDSRNSVQLTDNGFEISKELLSKNYLHINYLFRYSLGMWVNGNREFFLLIRALLKLRPHLIAGGFSGEKFILITNLLFERTESLSRLATKSLELVQKDIYEDEIKLVDLEGSISIENLVPESDSFIEQIEKILEIKHTGLDHVSPSD